MGGGMAIFTELVQAARALEELTRHWCDRPGHMQRSIRVKMTNLVDAVARLREGKRQLARAYQHNLFGFASLSVLFYQRELSVESFYEAAVRFDQLNGVLKRMGELKVTEWAALELPPQERTRRPEDHPRVARALEDRQRLEGMRSIPAQTPKIEVVDASRGRRRPPPRWLN
jgi:hypothetical protein